MTDMASLVFELGRLTARVGFAPVHVEAMLGLRSRPWPMALAEARDWRPTVAQKARVCALAEVCRGIDALMQDQAAAWLDAWLQTDMGVPAAPGRDVLGELRLEVRRQCGLD